MRQGFRKIHRAATAARQEAPRLPPCQASRCLLPTNSFHLSTKLRFRGALLLEALAAQSWCCSGTNTCVVCWRSKPEGSFSLKITPQMEMETPALQQPSAELLQDRLLTARRAGTAALHEGFLLKCNKQREQRGSKQSPAREPISCKASSSKTETCCRAEDQEGSRGGGSQPLKGDEHTSGNLQAASAARQLGLSSP